MIPDVYNDLDSKIRNVIAHATNLYGLQTKVWRTSSTSVFGDYGKTSNSLIYEGKLLITGFFRNHYGYFSPDRDQELYAWSLDDEFVVGDYIEITYNGVVYRYRVTEVTRIGTLNNLWRLTLVPTQEIL